MTLNDLKNEIAALGFDNGLSLDSSLILAVQRALRFAYAERGIHKSGVLYQRNPMPDIHVERVDHTPGVSDKFTFTGGAYSFTVSGEGEYTVSDRLGERTYDFNSKKTNVSGFIHGTGELSFSGDLCYTVYDLCHFPEIFAGSTESLRYTKFKDYDLKRLFPDYAAVADVVRDKNGNAVEGASVCSDTLSLPYEYVGKVVVKYRVSAPDISGMGADDDIGIDSELLHLIPLLAASYVWLDDDAEKAQYYMSLYRDGMAAIKVYDTRCLDTTYTDTTGWA